MESPVLDLLEAALGGRDPLEVGEAEAGELVLAEDGDVVAGDVQDLGLAGHGRGHASQAWN